MTPEEFNELAWHDGVLWAFGEPKMRAAFTEQTGVDLGSARSGMDRLIDESTGKQTADLERFIEWFTATIWGPEWAPEKGEDVMRLSIGGSELGWPTVLFW